MTFDLSGRVQQIVRRKDRDRAWVTNDIRNAYRRETMDQARSRGEADLEALSKALDDQLAMVPETHAVPDFDALMVDAVGRIWVRDFVRPLRATGSRGWEVFSTDGVSLARIQIPSDVSILQIGENTVTGLVRDSVGVEYVEVFTWTGRRSD